MTHWFTPNAPTHFRRSALEILHHTLDAASHVQKMAHKAPAEKLVLVLTGPSIAQVTMMAMRELRDLFKDKEQERDRHHDNVRGMG